MQRSMDEEGVLCSAGAAWVELTRALPPQLGKGSVAKPPRNPKNALPGALRDLRPLPSTVPRQQREWERPTYYWLYRCVICMGVWRCGCFGGARERERVGFVSGHDPFLSRTPRVPNHNTTAPF